ncbi:MAG: M20/M25/M40 family metallo-hydrolase [Candidatus Levybacteria bacterium]|nr:M20/M25/M40 family metallo-hydrolase [Candidatus Levybacteria bacterium]
MENNNSPIDLLEKLVSIFSVTGSENAIHLLIEKLLLKNNFNVQKQRIAKDRWNLFAQRGNGKSAILFLGHMDTIPAGNGWKTNPHVLVKNNGRLYGLGASDMKGGIAAFLSAATKTNAYVKILLTVDEENISEGAWKAIKIKSFFKDVKLIISAESNFTLKENDITVGRTGRCVYEVLFKGKEEHIIRYKEGTDAIELLGKFVNKLYERRSVLFQSSQTIAQVRKIEGESVGMSVCGMAKLEVEVLLGSGDSIGSVCRVLKQLGASKVNIKKRKTPYLESYYFDSFPYGDLIGKIVKKHIGNSMKLTTRISVADDNVLATLGIPVITWGAIGGNEHTANEFVNEDSLLKLHNVYLEFLNSI